MEEQIVNEWNLHCVTENINANIWSVEQPTQCPNDESHEISPNPSITQSLKCCVDQTIEQLI